MTADLQVPTRNFESAPPETHQVAFPDIQDISSSAVKAINKSACKKMEVLSEEYQERDVETNEEER
jgi:hypothetical protein